MDIKTAHILMKLNNQFYAQNAGSFSQTRQSPWQGWKRLAEILCKTWGDDDKRLTGVVPLRVLDVACGNLRFERFLHETFPKANIDTVAVDACKTPVPSMAQIDFREVDLAQYLLPGNLDKATWAQPVQEPPVHLDTSIASKAFDLVVCFGFFHHLPGDAPRVHLLKALMRAIKDDGVCAVSFWRFMNDETLAKKAYALQPQAFIDLAMQGIGFEPSGLDAGDYILGWQNKPGAYRYCHSFTDNEIALILEYVKADTNHVIRYHADGKSGILNDYVVVCNA